LPLLHARATIVHSLWQKACAQRETRAPPAKPTCSVLVAGQVRIQGTCRPHHLHHRGQGSHGPRDAVAASANTATAAALLREVARATDSLCGYLWAGAWRASPASPAMYSPRGKRGSAHFCHGDTPGSDAPGGVAGVGARATADGGRCSTGCVWCGTVQHQFTEQSKCFKFECTLPTSALQRTPGAPPPLPSSPHAAALPPQPAAHHLVVP